MFSLFSVIIFHHLQSSFAYPTDRTICSAVMFACLALVSHIEFYGQK